MDLVKLALLSLSHMYVHCKVYIIILFLTYYTVDLECIYTYMQQCCIKLNISVGIL